MTDAADPPGVNGAASSGRSTRGALVRSSALVGVGTALSRVTGLVRVVALLYALDQTRLSDVYTVANTMPNLVYELLLGGVLSATLVPVFTERIEDEDGGTSAVVSTAAMALVVVTVVGIVAAPWVIGVYAGGIDGAAPGEVAAYRDVGTTLLRFFMPQVLFYGLITIVTALLHSRRSFAAPAFAPILNNLVVSSAFFMLPALVDPDTTAPDALLDAAGNTTWLVVLGLGTTLGVVVMALAMVPSVARLRVPLRFDPNWRHPAVRTVVALSGWTVGYVVANQVALSVVLWLASTQTGGDVTAYNVAFTFFQLPHGLFAVSIMTTFLPELTGAAQAGDDDRFRDRLVLGVRLMALVILPASAGYVAIAGPLVSFLPIPAADAEVTSGVLAAFAVGLFGFSVYLFVLRGFYARKDTKTPFQLNVVENGLNILLALPLVVVAGVQGLAAAYSVAYLVAAVLALRSLGRRVGGLPVAGYLSPVGRMGLAAVACGVTAWLASEGMASFGALAQVALAVPVGAAVYVGLLVALRVEEIDTARRMVTERVRRRQS